MPQVITRLDYNWTNGQYESYVVGNEYFLDDVMDTATVTSIIRFHDSYVVEFSNGSEYWVNNINKVYYYNKKEE